MAKKKKDKESPKEDRAKSIFETAKYSYSLGLISEEHFQQFKDTYEKSKNT